MAITDLKLPKAIKEKIIAPIPGNLIKQRDGGGGKMLSYISGSTVTDMLNGAFGYMWSWDVDKEWIQDSSPFFNQYSKLPDDQKIMVNGKKGAWEEQLPVAHVKGRLTVYFTDESGKEREITKVGYGSKAVIGKQSEQDSIFKSAGTDALKKAASLLGIGLELYRDEDEQMYFNELNYEDPWTDEMQARFKDERDYLNNIMTEFDMDADGMAEYVSEFSDTTLSSLYDITPENITAFVDFIKAKVSAAAPPEVAPAPAGSVGSSNPLTKKQ